jgi:hypothetical protein
MMRVVPFELVTVGTGVLLPLELSGKSTPSIIKVQP